MPYNGPYLGGPYFGGGYFGTASGPAGSAYPDLLAALMAYLKGESTVTDLVTVGYGEGGYGQLGYGGTVRIYDEDGPADAAYPFVVVTGYTEVLPGESSDLESCEGTVWVMTTNIDDSRSIGKAVKAAIDPPSVNPDSLARDPLRWDGGHEVTTLRNNSRPQRMPGIGRGGVYVYAEEINYVFWVDAG